MDRPLPYLRETPLSPQRVEGSNSPLPDVHLSHDTPAPLQKNSHMIPSGGSVSSSQPFLFSCRCPRKKSLLPTAGQTWGRLFFFLARIHVCEPRLMEEGEGCPICFEAFRETDVAVTSCGHRFHTSCLCKSARRSRSCPMCRTDLFPLTEEEVMRENLPRVTLLLRQFERLSLLERETPS